MLRDSIPLESLRATPVNNIKAARQQIKFKDVASACIKSKKLAWSNQNTPLSEEVGCLPARAPHLGGMFVASIYTQDIHAVLNPILRDKTEAAYWGRARIEMALACVKPGLVINPFFEQLRLFCLPVIQGRSR